MGSKVGALLLSGNVAGAHKLSLLINIGGKAVQAFTKSRWGGNTVIMGGDDLMVAVDAGRFDPADVEKMRKLYASKTKATLSAGVGNSPDEAMKALVIAKNTGKNKSVFWEPEMEATYKKVVTQRLNSLRTKLRAQGGSDLSEDQRRTPETIKTRRDRLAATMRSALNARRAAKQTLDQARGSVGSIEKAPVHPHPQMQKAVSRLQTLVARHDSLKKKFVKRFRAAGRPSKLGPYHRNFRGAIDSPERPANPKTYGRGDKVSKELRGKPVNIWKFAESKKMRPKRPVSPTRSFRSALRKMASNKNKRIGKTKKRKLTQTVGKQFPSRKVGPVKRKNPALEHMTHLLKKHIAIRQHHYRRAAHFALLGDDKTADAHRLLAKLRFKKMMKDRMVVHKAAQMSPEELDRSNYWKRLKRVKRDTNAHYKVVTDRPKTKSSTTKIPVAWKPRAGDSDLSAVVSAKKKSPKTPRYDPTGRINKGKK